MMVEGLNLKFGAFLDSSFIVTGVIVASFPCGNSGFVSCWYSSSSSSWCSSSCCSSSWISISHSEGWHSSGFAGAVSGSGALNESNFNVLHVFDRLVHGVKFLEHLDTSFGRGSGGTDESKGEFHE
jgi:hypothetical protein